MAIKSEEDVPRAAAKLRALGCTWVLVKGGHLGGPEVLDLLVGPEGEQALVSLRIAGGPFHGTGCALSAALAAFLAQGHSISDAAREATSFLHRLIGQAHALGKGTLVVHPQSRDTDEERHE